MKTTSQHYNDEQGLVFVCDRPSLTCTGGPDEEVTVSLAARGSVKIHIDDVTCYWKNDSPLPATIVFRFCNGTQAKAPRAAIRREGDRIYVNTDALQLIDQLPAPLEASQVF